MDDATGPFKVGDDEVYALTESGGAQLRESGTSLAAAALELLVLIDGKATVAQIGRSAKCQTPEQVRSTLAKFYLSGLIDHASRVHSDAIDAGDFFSDTAAIVIPGASAAERDAEANDGVNSLKNKGYYVCIARRIEGRRGLPEGRKPTMLVIDDDTALVKLLNTVFRLEGFATRSAGNRAEIVAAFGTPAPPDLVLLDVMMPDVDGFQVLGRIRAHPVLKSVPVIMLTAKTSRESVLTGLRLGADGYITKPFDIDVLMTAVKTVLKVADESDSTWPKAGIIRNE